MADAEKNSSCEFLHSRRDAIAVIEGGVRFRVQQEASVLIYRTWYGHAQAELALARGWLGKCLAALGTANPYPHSTDPTSKVIEPAAYNRAMEPPFIGDEVEVVKSLRGAIQEIQARLPLLQALENGLYAEAWGFSNRHLQNAKMFLGERLGEIREEQETSKG